MKREHILAGLLVAFIAVFAYKTAKEAEQKPINPDKLKSEILQRIKAPKVPEFTANITDFGGMGDSLFDNKAVFQKLFAMAEEKGGIHIVVPEGNYFVKGPLHLESNVCLDLQKGATLWFSSDPKDYLPVVKTSWEGTFLYNYSPLIYAYQKENISIIGQGTINGNAAETFATWRTLQNESQALSRDMNHTNVPVEERVFGEGHYLRPQFVQFFECKNLLMEGITVTNSPFWCVHVLKSTNATFRSMKFTARNINNDGIDPEYSSDILIEDIDFDNGDDNVAIKAGRDHEGRAQNTPSENIIIRNCRLKGLHGVVIGSEMSGGVQNVFVENCVASGYLKRGIYLKSNPDRGGYMRNIYVDSLALDEVEDCFYITSFYHGQGEGHVTDIHNVHISNITCKRATAAGIVIQGFSEKPIHDIYFQNVMIDTAKIALSLTNTTNIVMNNVCIGGVVSEAPTSAQP
ncbi:MAG: glycoside hydrolase family 28 protein [Bacteroidales bacterium]|jgi:polygalacturonase|nr:glycoside hydrolase family 28 protein [Bacteroidales bacterium]